jgi:vitamin K-dependent gamma-carboxylase
VNRFAELAMRPVDVASLAAFRIIFGAIMCFGALRLIASGWLEPMYVEPTWAFKYPGFGWVEAWPAWGMYLHYAVLAVLALMIALGAWHRLVTLLFTIGFLYTQLIDVTNYLNHNYLVVLIGAQLALLPANAAWSIDARRDPSVRRAAIPAWNVWLLRFQIGVVYVFAGLAKLKADWLLHGQPLNLWLSTRTDTPVIGGVFDQPSVALAMSWAGFLFDTTIVLWLSWVRTRIYAYIALVVFHAATGYLLNIGMFPFIMTTSALIFFSPSWPRRLLGRPIPEIPATPFARPRKLLVYLIAAHVALQIVLPLRHVLYPGSVLWNEDGMRFAWHVVVREKNGSVMFVAEFANGKRLEIPPRNYLTARQEREMAGQPDLILQLARHIGVKLKERGFRDFQIHAVTAVSLNGRRPAPLVDPLVDLLEITDLGPRSWVLSAPDTPPAKLRPLQH